MATEGGARVSETPTPRAAAVLLTRALTRVDRIQPPELRKPIAAMLLAGVEQCTVSTSLLGKPVNNLLDLARALADEEGP